MMPTGVLRETTTQRGSLRHRSLQDTGQGIRFGEDRDNRLTTTVLGDEGRGHADDSGLHGKIGIA